MFIPEPGSRHAVHLVAGRLRDGLFVLRDRRKQGFNRNLAVDEIIGQVSHANRNSAAAAQRRTAVTNVVFMGMGEPLANYRNRRASAGDPVLRLRVRSVAPPGNRQHLRHRAADRPAGRRLQRLRWPCRCTPRTMRCVMSWCRSTACIRSKSCSMPAGATPPSAPTAFITFEYVMLQASTTRGGMPRLPRRPAEKPAGQGQPDSLQPVSRQRLQAVAGAGHQLNFQERLRARGLIVDNTPDPRRRYRCCMRAAGW